MRSRSAGSFAVLAALIALASPGAAAAGPYQVLGATTTQAGGLVRTETLIQGGPSPLDRFTMVRLVKDVPPQALRGALLLLPPLGVNFSFYEQRDPGGPAETSIAGFFAHRNYDVYGYSARYTGIPAGTCEAGLFDCSVMAGWDLQSMVDDATFIRGQIEALRPGVEVSLGGASLGGILAVAVVNAHPADYAGAIVWEGMLFTPDPTVQAMNQAYCAGLEAQLAAGLTYDGVGTNVAQQVAHLARIAPAALTPNPLFPPFFTNHQALVALFAEITPGPVTLPVPNYVAMNGSLAQDRLFYASEPRIFEDLERFNHYSPLVLVRDISCTLAGLDATHIANLANYHGRVIGIGGGRGFGPYMPDTLDLMGTNDVTFLLTPEFGHIDHFMTPDHREYVEKPILRWLEGGA